MVKPGFNEDAGYFLFGILIRCYSRGGNALYPFQEMQLIKNIPSLSGIDPLPAALLPTPLHPLDNLRKILGDSCPYILIKRDDLTGLALGGNKARKLAYLLADARSKHADTILTCGAAQSNHALQTSMAARKFGFNVRCMLIGPPPNPAAAPAGNLLLHKLAGTEIIWISDHQSKISHEQMLIHAMQIEAEKLAASGRTVYSIPLGGSTAVGALGYAEAILELREQHKALGLSEISAMFCASGSGGTQAGLMVGAELANWKIDVVGVEIEPESDASNSSLSYRDAVKRLLAETKSLLKIESGSITNQLMFESGYTGSAYAVSTREGEQAINLLAETEGIVLDPVYTGNAMAAMLGWIREGRFRPDQTILFWHTGGAAGLFA